MATLYLKQITLTNSVFCSQNVFYKHSKSFSASHDCDAGIKHECGDPIGNPSPT